MTGGTAARLGEPTDNREARIFRKVQVRHQFFNTVEIVHHRVDAIQPHRVATARESVTLCIVMEDVQNTALAEHDVVVQLLAQAFPQFHRVLVKLRVCIEHVIRPHDGGVTPGVAPADITFLQHSHIGNAV